MPDVIDFLVLHQFYNEAKERNWQIGNDFHFHMFAEFLCLLNRLKFGGCVLLIFSEYHIFQTLKWGKKC